MSRKLLGTLDLQGYACRDEGGTVKVIVNSKPVRRLGYTEYEQSARGKRVAVCHPGYWKAEDPFVSSVLYPTWGDENQRFVTNAYFNELQWDDLPVKVDISISPTIEHGDE